MNEQQSLKQQAIDRLRYLTPVMEIQLRGFDERLVEYYHHLMDHSGIEKGDANDLHNTMELLGALKLLRLINTYVCDYDGLHDVVYMYEGEWRQEGKLWKHVKGGVRHPNDNFPDMYYRLQPFQIFILVAIFGMRCWVNTKNEAGTRELLPSEKIIGDTIWDLRRLCTEFTLFTPRKTAKTQLSAFIQFWFFMCGDVNAECYCCANAADQSKILFNRTSSLIRQMDPQEKRIRFTAQTVNWKPGQFRTASLTALSAGGKTKDGTFAQLCSADEFGSAGYVNGKSDMGKLVSVIESSMGPRREPMTFISTTAGVIQAGPFIDKLFGIENVLKNEVSDIECPAQVFRGALVDTDDRHMCLLLEPDEWEKDDEEFLFTSQSVRRKINPMLGIIVQHSFYDDEVSKARKEGPEKLADVIAKDFNVYHGVKGEEWIRPDAIRANQQRLLKEVAENKKYATRIDHCTADKGWVVFAGMDFSMGNDLYAHGYLGVNVNTGDILADLDAWITQTTLEKISIRPLYEQWIKDGWLHVFPGDVVDVEQPVCRMMQLTGWDIEQKKFTRIGCNIMRIGYDPYRSPDPVNMLKAWVHDMLGLPPDVHVVAVSQTNGNYNQPTEQLTQSIKHPRSLLRFSPNPLWPYCFGCAVLDHDRMENKRPVKRNASDACKVDPIQALLTAWITWNNVEARERPAE